MMPYIVTELKHTDKGRVQLCLNDEKKLWLYAAEARQLSLEEGVALSEEQYQKLLHEIIGKRAVKRAMHLLERQGRTEYQLREKLLQSEYPAEAVEDAVSYVKQYHYVDDERYARVFIRSHQEKRSKRRIRQDLMRRGVSDDIIDLCMEEEYDTSERAQIKELLAKKSFSPDTADWQEYGRIYRFLLRRGFSGSDISAVMQGRELF